MFPAGAMPLVQRLEFSFRAWDVVRGRGRLGLDDLRMEHLPALEEVHVELWYREEDDRAVVERVAAALQQVAEDHPNRLALRINKRRIRLGHRHRLFHGQSDSIFLGFLSSRNCVY